jgi:CDP-glucose 4,6-dehydratase
MENLEMTSTTESVFNDFFRGKHVAVTGHTGFKGSWLCEWLLELGAEVHGFALDPEERALFTPLDLANRIASDTRADLKDPPAVKAWIERTSPEVVFHLAAQPLVRYSYEAPVETFQTNVMGTIHVLEALRSLRHPVSAVMITTDKCYENREWVQGYREEDPMGGHDPYSASKGCAELAIASYRRSFFPPGGPVRVASARAGNVIGGGDWATDRIIPDCFRALEKQRPISVRNKTSTRPWQHVLEPLSGYLLLASRLGSATPDAAPDLCSAFNFGPALSSNRTVADVVEEVLKHVPGEWRDDSDPHAVHEAGKLSLTTDKAFHLLGWSPKWDFQRTVEATAAWYFQVHNGTSAAQLTREQIRAYAQKVKDLMVPG